MSSFTLQRLSEQKLTYREYLEFMRRVRKRIFPEMDEIEVVRLYGELGVVIPPPVPDLVSDISLPPFLNPNRSFGFCVRKDEEIVALTYGIYSIEPYSQPVEGIGEIDVGEDTGRKGAHAQVLGLFHTAKGE